jgi:uncharacterized membrane protein YphA (DoxX/SURF4 family)
MLARLPTIACRGLPTHGLAPSTPAPAHGGHLARPDAAGPHTPGSTNIAIAAGGPVPRPGHQIVTLPGCPKGSDAPGMWKAQPLGCMIADSVWRMATRESTVRTPQTPDCGLASVGFSVMRCGLATCFLWIGALKFKEYEVQNAERLVTASPLTSRLREKLGAQKLARIVGVTQITLGSLIAAKPFAPRASAVGSFGAAGMMLSTLSFLVHRRR